jgi:hypothetical protein
VVPVLSNDLLQVSGLVMKESWQKSKRTRKEWKATDYQLVNKRRIRKKQQMITEI